MPVFAFQNDWRDWRFSPARRPLQDDNDGDGGGLGPREGQVGLASPVLSGYFWIFLAVTLAFTLVTLEVWWRFTRGEVDRRGGRHWTTYLACRLWAKTLGRFRRRRQEQSKNDC
jgi:hypothetical protein